MHHRLPLSNPWSSTPSCTLTCPIDVPSLPQYHPSTAQPPNTLSSIWSSTWRAVLSSPLLHPSIDPLPSACVQSVQHLGQTLLHRLPHPMVAPCPSSHEPMVRVHHGPATSWINGHGPYPVPSPCPFTPHSPPLPRHQRTEPISLPVDEER